MAVVISQYSLPFASPFGVRTDFRCERCSYRVTELENVIFRTDNITCV